MIHYIHIQISVLAIINGGINMKQRKRTIVTQNLLIDKSYINNKVQNIFSDFNILYEGLYDLSKRELRD